MKTQSITVAGRSFKIKSDADEKYLQELADSVSKRFKAVSHAGGHQDQDLKLMAMVAIELVDDLNESKKHCDEIKKKAREFTSKMVAKIDAFLSGKSV